MLDKLGKTVYNVEMEVLDGRSDKRVCQIHESDSPDVSVCSLHCMLVHVYVPTYIW